MKLATYINGTRDGALVIVSKDLKHACFAHPIAPTLQFALDHWQKISGALIACYERLNQGLQDGAFDFDVAKCLAPLPRAYQWADGSAYVNHVELVRRARGADMPESFWTDPLMYQGGSDDLLAATAPIVCADEAWGIDFEAEVAVITHDVRMGASLEAASQSICLLMLVNDVSLRNLIPAELAKGFGFFQSKPATAFSPVAITPDELGDHWQDTKVHLPILVTHNGKQVGCAEAGVDMVFNFAQLVAHVAKTRNLGAGSIIGSGTISNRDTSKGYSCIAEKRALEMIEHGKPITPFMAFGDTVKIDMHDQHGKSLFGAITQTVVKLNR